MKKILMMIILVLGATTAMAQLGDGNKDTLTLKLGTIGHFARNVNDPGVLASLAKATQGATTNLNTTYSVVFREKQLVAGYRDLLMHVPDGYDGGENAKILTAMTAIYTNHPTLQTKITKLLEEMDDEYVRLKKAGLDKLAEIYEQQ